MSPAVSRFLDQSRWIAALLVVYGHLARLCVGDQPQVASGNVVAWLLVQASCFGHAAVMVFFVMSGYLVGGPIWDRLTAGTFDLRIYLINRLARLYPVLFVGVSVGAFLDLLAMRYWDTGGVYTPGVGIWYPVKETISWTIAGINLIFCQTILGPTIGSNSPLWSLANEWWYYILWPLIVMVVAGTDRSRKILAGMTVVTLLVFLPRSLLIYAMVWILGAWLPKITLRPPVPAKALVVFFIVVAVLLPSLSLGERLQPWLHFGLLAHAIPDLLLAVAFSLVILAHQRTVLSETSVPVSVTSIHRFLADFSYSLYVIHLPIGLAALAAMAGWLGLTLPLKPESLSTWGFVFVLILAAYVAALGVWFVAERHSARLRAWLTARLLASPS